MTSTDQYSMKLPLHVGTGRGHHETIFDRDGDLVGYTAAGNREKDAAAAQELVQAANAYPGLVAALQNARLQITYLHEKFKETGSGNQVLAQIDAALAGTPPHDTEPPDPPNHVAYDTLYLIDRWFMDNSADLAGERFTFSDLHGQVREALAALTRGMEAGG